ncbi:MAG TPA: UDP-2,3-diacylglucosamine diphosphatase, partial [Bacteroidota bacterium]|nr:UDP-2,3-diacylglucosamine diphosphatase [Bacteroidota bacterium]
GLAHNDTGYRFLKKILRNRLFIWLYSWLHPDIGVALAQFSSKRSRDYTQNKDYGNEDGMMQFARQKIGEGYDVVIMGHRHKPVSEKIGNGIYINLGDWITYNTYAEMTGGEIILRHWE